MPHPPVSLVLALGFLSDQLTCLLRNLYAGQEATARTRHGKTDWFQIGKGVHQGCILSPCLFNLYVEYIMRNAGLDEAHTGIKIARRNINNLRCRCQPAKLIRSQERARRSWEILQQKNTTTKMGLRGSDTSPRRDTVWPWLYSASYIYTGECEKDKTVSIFFGWPIYLTKSHKKSWEHGNGTLLLFFTPDNIFLCVKSLSKTPSVCSK